MDKELFFEVWDCTDLRRKIKQFMYPGCQTCNYYNYTSGKDCIINNYEGLLIEKGIDLTFEYNKYAEYMCIAAMKGNKIIVNWLYSNYIFDSNQSAIDMAAESNNFELVKWFWYETSLINYTVRLPNAIIKHNNIEMAKWFYQINIDYECILNIDVAVINNNLIMAEYLSSYNYQPSQSAILIAAGYGYWNIIEWALCLQLNIPNNIVDWAASSDNINLVKWLIDNGFSPTPTAALNAAAKGSVDILIYLKSQFNIIPQSSAWIRAADNNYIEVIKWLYSVNIIGDYNEAFCVAASKGNINIMKWLANTVYVDKINTRVCIDMLIIYHIKYAAEVWTDYYSAYYTSEALSKAIEMNNIEAIMWLMAVEHCEYKAACLAAKKGNRKIFRFLIELLNIQLKTELANRVICDVIKLNRLSIVKLIFKLVNIKRPQELVNYAISCGKLQIAEWIYNNYAKGCELRLITATRLGYLHCVKWCFAITTYSNNDILCLIFLAIKFNNINILNWMFNNCNCNNIIEYAIKIEQSQSISQPRLHKWIESCTK